MAVIKEYKCLAHGDFDSVNGVCPHGCTTVVRAFRTAPGGRSEKTKKTDATLSRLAEKFGLKIIISGAKKDIGLAEEIKKMMKSLVVITCGRTTLKELGALLERAHLVVANDTGPMHLAVAMKAKTIALFGPTSPAITGPYGESCYKVISKNDSCDIPCYDFTCTDNRCMRTIEVEDVLEEAVRMLEEGCR